MSDVPFRGQVKLEPRPDWSPLGFYFNFFRALPRLLRYKRQTTTIIEGPRHNITIREHFTCKPSNVIFWIPCRRCPALYIEETVRMLRERTGEHLRTITRNPRPVAEHFNMPWHGLDDMEVRGLNSAGVLTTPDTVTKCTKCFILAPLLGHLDKTWIFFKQVDGSALLPIR